MATYNLKYFAEIHNFRGQLARVEILQRSNSAFSVLEIGDVCGLALEIQGGTEDIFTPIVKTSARLSMVSCDDKPTADGVKYGDWGEFYTPDATLYKMRIKTKPNASASSWTTRWTGYITPDSWQEGLEYRGVITITARDNIGHLQDFEFDMDASEADAYGLVSIRSVLAAAMNKIALPMTYVNSSAPATIEADGTGLLDAKVALEKLQGRDWYSVIEGLLDSIGYTLRYTDSNRVTVAPLRYLPLLGETSRANQPTMEKLEFFGGVGEMVPAVKKITEVHTYDYNAAVGIPIFGQMVFGSNETYRCKVDGNTMPAGGKFSVPEHDAPTNKVTNPKSTAWLAGSDILNQARITGPYWNSDDETLYNQYVLLPANGVEGSKRTQALEFLCDSTDVVIEAVFAEYPISIKDTYGDFKAVREGHTLALIVYELSYTVGGQTQYWDGHSWNNTARDVKVEYDSQNDKATTLSITLQPNQMGRGGLIRFSFKDIQYKCFYPYAYSGVYARLSSFQVSVNKDNLVRNTVRTVNSEQYNVLLNREPDFAPLSRDVSMAVPQNYPSALYHYPSGSAYPTQYPYQGNWDNLNTEVVKPLAVLIHQQILCYRGASLWELNGECAPEGGGLFRFNTLPRYKNRTYILMSGTLDFLTGSVVGAILREFLEYDEIWDDTEQGDWSDASTYVRDGAAPVTSYGGYGGGGTGGGGGVNYFEEDGQGGIKLKDDYNGLWAKGFVTSGGIGSDQGGGGGSIDLDRVWESLTNNTDKPNVKINVAHIPNLEISNINGLADALAQAGSVKSLTVGTTNYTPASNGIITIPAYPTALASPYALTFGSKTYDGSAAKTITASDLGALTAVPKATNSVIGGFQTGYSESGKNYAVQMSGDKAFVNVPWTDTVYSLPPAANGTRGGVQIGYSESNSGSSSDRNYAVKLSSEKMYVNVPWTDTVYTHPTNGANVTISAANGKVLSAITVNNLGHVTSVSSKTLAAADIPDLSSVYLPLTGGTLTGDLRLKTGGTYYGSKLNFGDGDYVYLNEDTDDHLKIYAAKGLELSVGSTYGIKFGDGVLTWDSANSAWKLTGNLYATGFITAGGVNAQNGIVEVEHNVVINSGKTVTFGQGVLSYSSSSGWLLSTGFQATTIRATSSLLIGTGSSAVNVGSVLQSLSGVNGTLQNHEQRITALENAQ